MFFFFFFFFFFFAKAFGSWIIGLAEQLTLLPWITCSSVRILLEAKFNLWLYGDSLHRAFHYHLWMSWCNVTFIVGIKHDFSCINIRQVPWEMLKTDAEGRGFQHLPRDLANVNALKNHVRSLLLHKNWKHLLHFALFLALCCFAFSPTSRKRNFHWLCSF